MLAELLRGRWSQGALTGLVVDLGGLWEPVTLRDRLARALGDRSLELGYWVGGDTGYVDEAGRPFVLPKAGPTRAVTPIERDGELVAVLVHDPAALQDRAVLDAVAAATRLAVANVRLQAEVHDRVEQVAASRRRIVEAADVQRGRLEASCTRAPSGGWPRSPSRSPRWPRTPTMPGQASCSREWRNSSTRRARSWTGSHAASGPPP